MPEMTPHEPDPAIAENLRMIADCAGDGFHEARLTWPDYLASTRAFLAPLIRGLGYSALFILMARKEVSDQRSSE